MTFESGFMPEDWRSAVIVPLYKGKGEMTKCKNYTGISLLSVVGKIYEGILIDRVLSLKQIGKKVGFIGLEKRTTGLIGKLCGKY